MVFSNGGLITSGEFVVVNDHLNPRTPPVSVVNYGNMREGVIDDEFEDVSDLNGDDRVEESTEMMNLNSSSLDDSRPLGDHLEEIEKREIEIEEAGEQEMRSLGDHLEAADKQGMRDEQEASNGESFKTNVNVGEVEQTMILPPIPQLPKPEAPRGIVDVMSTETKTESSPSIKRSNSAPGTATAAVQIPAIGKFFREKGNSLSAAITKRLNSLKEYDDLVSEKQNILNVTEFKLSGLKVIVKLKNENDDYEHYKGRISFFSRSNCRDSRAVRSFLRDRRLSYVEINIDVFPMREKELIERTGSSAVPQIFFNEKLFGGLVALNSLRNCGMLEEKMKELLCRTCPDDAPAPPVYGFDDPEEEKTDEMITVVRVLRQKLLIQDRLLKMKLVKNCFSATEMVDVLVQQFDLGRKEAVEIGKQLARKHFIHHVFGNDEFEDGNHFYRFLEHEPFISRCFNFRGSTNDLEPKGANVISLRLTKIMSAVLESYASDDRYHLDYISISNSEEFRRYVNLMHDLQRVDIWRLTVDERLAFFINLYNAMVIHAIIRVGHPGAAVIDRRSFNSDFIYVIGGLPYSLTTIKNGVLRNNQRAPYSFAKPFGNGDKRLELTFPKVNPLIHFGLCNGTRSSPPVRFFTPQGIESELRYAAREFLLYDGFEVDLAKRTIYLTRMFKWFNADFGTEKDILKWIINYLDATKAGLLTHLLADNGPINIVYQDYDWSINC